MNGFCSKDCLSTSISFIFDALNDMTEEEIMQ